MTYEVDLSLPRLGDGGSGGRVVAWLKQPGDTFQRSDILLEVETDKAIVEVPALDDGVLLEHRVREDSWVDFQDAIARVSLAGEPPEEELENTPLAPESVSGGETEEQAAVGHEAAMGTRPGNTGQGDAAKDSSERVLASPFARKLAREQSIALADVTGTGKSGRIVGRDVQVRLAVGVNARISRPVTSVSTEEFFLESARGQVFVRRWQPAEQGSCQTLLLLHGLFADMDAWSATATTVARQGVTVYALDLPCHGRSTCAARSFDDVVTSVTAAVEKLGLSNAVLVGHSYGAAVAARVSALLPGVVSRLMLIAPLGVGSRIDQGFLDSMIHAESIGVLQRELKKLSTRVAPPGKTFLQALLQKLSARSSDLESMVGSVARHGVQQVCVHEVLAGLPIPVSVLIGKCDAILPWQEFLDVPPTVALHLFGQAGHMPQWDEGSLTARLIADSLALEDA